MHDETNEQEHGGYSRIGTAIFFLTMAFPFVAVGWKLLFESAGAFIIYTLGVVIMTATWWWFFYYAPRMREPDPPARHDLESFNSEREGVPW